LAKDFEKNSNFETNLIINVYRFNLIEDFLDRNNLGNELIVKRQIDDQLFNQIEKIRAIIKILPHKSWITYDIEFYKESKLFAEFE